MSGYLWIAIMRLTKETLGTTLPPHVDIKSIKLLCEQRGIRQSMFNINENGEFQYDMGDISEGDALIVIEIIEFLYPVFHPGKRIKITDRSETKLEKQKKCIIC